MSNTDARVSSPAVGFAQLRWGMSRQEARKRYPQARTTPFYEGRNPSTGERIVAGGDELIPELQRLASSLAINATLTFDGADRLVAIELWPDPLTGATEPLGHEQLTTAASELAESLTLGSLTELPERRQWTLGGTMIELTGDEGFRFVLSRPTTAPLATTPR